MPSARPGPGGRELGEKPWHHLRKNTLMKNDVRRVLQMTFPELELIAVFAPFGEGLLFDSLGICLGKRHPFRYL